MNITERAAIAERYGTSYIYVVRTNSFSARGYRKVGRIEYARVCGKRGGLWSVFSLTTMAERMKV